MIAREAHHNDAAAIAELWRRFMVEEHDAVPDASPDKALESWSARLHQQISSGTVLVLQVGEGIVGFASFVDSTDLQWVPSEVAYIVDIYIQPEHRRAGAATKLFALLMDRMADAGYRETWTNTSVTNRRMQHVLERWGFAPNPGFQIPGLKDQLYVKRTVDRR